MKKRLLSLLCTAALLAGLMPTAALAAGTDTGKAIQLVDSGTAANISGWDSTDGYDYIYYGNWTAPDSHTTSGPIKWRVLDDQTNTDGTGLFLLTDTLLGSGTYGGVYFDNSSQYSNVWQGSDAQTWCQDFYSSNFSTGEQSAVIATTKSDEAFTSSTNKVSFAASENILNGDKVFFLSTQEAENSEYGFTNDAARIAYYGGSAGGWWLRSPGASDADHAGVVNSYGYVLDYFVKYDWAARPAFNLDLTSVLFTSAAVGGKSVSGMDSGLTAVGDYTGSEWKLTLLDESRNFSISNATMNGSGDTVVFSYSDAQTGANEYISVVIVDNGAITHYGRILQLDGTTNGASGSASLTLPADVTLDNDTKLYVFNEQYNGGENDDTKLTDYASRLIEIANPAVDETAPTLTAGEVSRDSENAATVRFTSDEAGTYYYAVVESGADAPDIDTTVAGIACIIGENTISIDALEGTGAKDIYIVAKDAVGNVSRQLKITIPAYIAPSYGISASPTELDFGSKTVGYTEAPAAKTVTITNTGNQTVTVSLPAGTNYAITAGEDFAGGAATLAPDGTAAFTVQPNTGLAAGTYAETLTISGSNGTSANISLSFLVEQRPSTGGGGSSHPTPTKTPSQQAIDKIKAAKDGETVTIDLPEGKTTLDKEVFETLAGREVTLVLNLEDEVSWSIYGLDLPKTASFADTDMGVSMNAGSVPVDILNAITGEVGTMQLTLAHDGDFGFTLTLTAPLGQENAGYWANLYYFDEDAETLTFRTSAKIDEDGTASLVFTHASQYVIVIDDRDHTPKDFPFVDVSESDWFYEAVDYAFQRDLMNGTDPTHFTPDGTSSRAMVATILWRMAGEPAASKPLTFADVPAGTWYTEAVAWAAENGIVTGYSDTKFGPDDPVTREQFAAMLYRYAQTLGEGFTGSWAYPLNFPDADQVSDYAYEALCWLTMENVIQGMEDGGLHPQGTATRAQLATMLQRFCQAADL